MTSKFLLRFGFLLALAASPAVAAAPESQVPTGSGSGDQYGGGEPTHHGFDASTLFDPVGVPLLRISGPQYLHLGPRNKLRFRNDSGSDLGGAAGGIGQVGGGGDSTFGITPPLPWVPGEEIPEPALLTLFVPALWLVMRRRAQRQITRA
jgi:hypothetical protein